MNKRTLLRRFINMDNRYGQYVDLEDWLHRNPVRVIELIEVDEDTLAVLYEQV